MMYSKKEIEKKCIKSTKFNLTGTQLSFMVDGYILAYEDFKKQLEAKENEIKQLKEKNV